jgi:hypothetical protein
MIELFILALLAAVIIKWPLILWAAATISGVLGLVAKDVGRLMLAVFIGLLAWYLYGGIPFLR